MAKNHYVTKTKRRSISKTRAKESAERIAGTMAKLREREKAEEAYQLLTPILAAPGLREAYFSRPDILVLAPEEQEHRFAEHLVKVDQFFRKIATMNPIHVFYKEDITEDIKLVGEVAELDAKPDSEIDTSDIPEVTDWSGAEVGKFYRPKE